MPRRTVKRPQDVHDEGDLTPPSSADGYEPYEDSYPLSDLPNEREVIEERPKLPGRKANAG